ncbi:MAG: nodulation protein NfeD, partial [Rhodothermales bacterium]
MGAFGLAPGTLSAQPGEAGFVLQIRLDDDPITPVTARFIERALEAAREEGARGLVIELDTPGGLMASTQDIVKNILASEVPVVVYVAPSGARAASAGVFITMAAHVAAMAPGTHIGAAHPVSVGGSPVPPPAQADTTSGDAQPRPGVMEEKVVNDAMAWARSLAELRGRNAEWAALAVSESRSITNTEALDQNVVDLVAATLDDLLAQLDGRKVALPGDSTQMRTAGAVIRPLRMWWGEQLLGVLSNPNVAFLLLMFGFYGILFEFYSPGWGVGGTLGAIFLVLGFFGLAVLPVNYAGLALIGLGLGLFVAEAFFTSFGALTLGGVVCLVLGGVMLIDSPVGVMRVSLSVVLPVALATAAITVVLVGSVVKAMRGRVQTGSEGMLGTEAVAVEAFVQEEGRYRGMVRTHGEWWRAVSTTPVAAGNRLGIESRDGLTLFVRLLEPRPDGTE